MPEYLFGFTCRSDESCIAVQGIMKNNFTEIKTNPKNHNYDHTGIIYVANIQEALKIKKSLKEIAGSHISSIEITSGRSE